MKYKKREDFLANLIHTNTYTIISESPETFSACGAQAAAHFNTWPCSSLMFTGVCMIKIRSYEAQKTMPFLLSGIYFFIIPKYKHIASLVRW